METLREYFILRARRYYYDKNLGFDSMTEQLVLYVIALLFILMFPIVFGWIMAPVIVFSLPFFIREIGTAITVIILKRKKF